MTTNLKGRRGRWLTLFIGFCGLNAFGCQSTPISLTDGPAPLRMPRPGGDAESFEDSLSGGEVFAMYCNQCHNARALGERPFSNYQNVAAHMRVRANLTGVEYAKLTEFLRRWHDVPSSTAPVAPSPKRQIYSQPIAELHDEIAPKVAGDTTSQPQPKPNVPAPALVPSPPQPLGPGVVR